MESALSIVRRDETVSERGALRISVYDDAYIREVHQLLRGADSPPTLDETLQPRRQIAGSLWQVMVVDTPSSTYAPTPEDLQKMRLTEDQAWEVARTNMRTMAGQAQFEACEDGFWLLILDGYYENALLTVPEIWDGMATVVGGTPVAVSAARGFLLVGNAEDLASVTAVRRVAQEVFDTRGHPISTEMLIWRDGSWVPY